MKIYRQPETESSMIVGGSLYQLLPEPKCCAPARHAAQYLGGGGGGFFKKKSYGDAQSRV